MEAWRLAEFIPDSPGVVRTIHAGDCYAQSKSKSRSLKITRKPNGDVSAICFRCGDSFRFSDPSYRFTEAAKIPRNHDKSDTGIPDDIERVIGNWDSAPRVWIRRAGITQAHCDRYGIGYSPSVQRVYIPVGKGTVGRGFFQNARYHIEGKVTEFVAKSDTSDACVLVEDCLSAIRVCDAGVTAVALLGTYLKESTWVLLQSYKRFLVWLDDDNPQVKLAQTKIGQRLSQIGPTRVVRGNREPKLLTNSEISDTVNTL